MPINYRGISLLNCAGKVLARILFNRLYNEVLELIIPEEQCGFRSERSTIGLISLARQIQEECWERFQPLYVLFVDTSKAFDTVDRQALWKVLRKFDCPSNFTHLIKWFYEGNKARGRFSWSNSGSFNAVSKVKQGCVLAPALFNLYVSAILIVDFSD